jgi:hypothetical protein
MKEWLKEKYGSYETRTAVTDVGDIGHYVARIVVDERTLGRYVFCWGDEVTQGIVVKLVGELCPEKVEFKHVSDNFLSLPIKKRNFLPFKLDR